MNSETRKSMIISVSVEDRELIRNAAKEARLSMSKFFLTTVLERIKKENLGRGKVNNNSHEVLGANKMKQET